jgi:hypothetical protein
MSIVAPPASCACSVAETRRRFCDFVNFYESQAIAREATARMRGAILTMDAALTLAGLLMLPLTNIRQ